MQHTHFSAVADVCFQRGAAESPAAPVASVTATRCICFQLASTSSVSGRLHVPLLSRESGVWWTRACVSLHSGLEMLAFGQVSQPVSINAVINSVSDVSGILYALCCRLSHTDSHIVVWPAAMLTGGSQLSRYQRDAATRKRSRYHTCKTCSRLFPQRVSRGRIILHVGFSKSSNPSR